MKATTKNKEILICDKASITTEELMQMLSCGRKTAVEIGTKAKGRISCGRRVLWSVKRVSEYLDTIAE